MNASELNTVLSDEMKLLRSGKSKPEQSIAVVRIAAATIANERLQLQYFKQMGITGTLAYFGKQVVGQPLPAAGRKKLTKSA